MNRLRHGDLGRIPELAPVGNEAAIAEHPDELLRVQRIAACTCEQRALRVGRKHGALEERGDESRGVLRREWRE